ncbi:MAG: right-handed parallel beta-helix repeat-containing protein [Chloroflexota bacterium]
MNDDRNLERTIASTYEETAPPREPRGLLDDILLTTRQTRQRPSWLALIKEPPMRISSSIAVGSPTVRVAAIMVATLLIALVVVGAGIAGSRLLAADGNIIVDQNGGGDYTTITAAVEAALDGDTILVKPGTYAEHLLITEAITLEGDGEPDEIVLEFTDEGQRVEGDDVPYGIWFKDSDAVVRNLTVRGPQVARAIAIDRGAPTLEHLVVDLEFPFADRTREALSIVDGSTAFLNDVSMNAWLGIIEASPTIESSRISCGTSIEGPGSDAVLRSNVFRDDLPGEAACGWGLVIENGASPTLEDNDISMQSGGVEISGPGTAPVIKGNRIHDIGTLVSAGEGAEPRTVSESLTQRAISVTSRAEPLILSNELTGNGAGIFIGNADPIVEGNTITNGTTGIDLVRSSATLTDNIVREMIANGIAISTDSRPSLVGNRSCDNGRNLFVDEASSPQLDESNEICADASPR